MAILKKWIPAALVMILFLSSCEVKEIHEDYTDPVNSFTQSYTVYQKDWKIANDDDSGIYYYCEFREPNLTQYIYDYGTMQAFLLINNGNLSPLPFNDYWIDGSYQWTEQATCEFRPGYVTFILKYSDHTTDAPHYDYDFRVRFLW